MNRHLARFAVASCIGGRGGRFRIDAQNLAAVLRIAGIQTGDRVAQVSENRYEWIIADLAMHLAGAVHVPIHVTLAGEQMAEQIADCGARLVFVSSCELLAKFRRSHRSGHCLLRCTTTAGCTAGRASSGTRPYRTTPVAPRSPALTS